MCFSCSIFFRFLAIFQVLKCAFLIFHLLPCFLPFSRSYSVCVSFSKCFHVSRHIPDPTVCFSHFPWFSEFFFFFFFLAYSTTYFTSYSVCVSISTFFTFLAIFQFLQCAFLIFHHFQCFSPYSRSYSVCVSFSTFISFFSIIQVLQCVFLISHDFQFSCYIPGPAVWISHFPRFSIFSTYSRSYSVCFSFSMIFSFLATFQFLNCAFLIFHHFQCFSPYSRS